MTIRVDRRLYLTADKKRVVGEGDPGAAFLYAAVGDELNDADARRYGLLDEEPETKPREQAGASVKESRPGGTKVRYPAGTKAAKR